MLASSRLSEVYGGSMWFPGQKKLSWATAPASVVASARAEQLARAREEMIGLLADLPESEHELSFSDLVVVSDQDKAAESEDLATAVVVSSVAAESEGRPADHTGLRQESPSASVKEGRDGDLGASKRRRCRSGGSAAGSEMQPVGVKANRSSCSGSAGGEGVLLNLYMPSSLTRSLTTGSASRSRRYGSTRERPAASTTATVSEGTQKAKLGCWSSMWATKEKQRNTQGGSSRTAEEKGKNGTANKNKKTKVQSVRRDSIETLV